MKRKLAIILSGTMVILSGCTQQAALPDSVSAPATEEAQATETEVQEDATEAAEQTEETTEEAAEEPAEEATEAVSSTLSSDYFELTIPEDLVDIVSTDVSGDRIDVYHKESKDAGFGGLIFSIWAVPVPKQYAGGPYTKIGEITGENGEEFDVVRGSATEIQWDYNIPDMPDDFKKIYDAADSIIASLTGINGYTYAEGAGMKGEDLYTGVLAKYVTAVKEEWDANKYEENGMSPEFFATGKNTDGDVLDKIGYAYQDINCDGIEELFVGIIDEGEEADKNLIYDVYTMVDHEPVSVVSGNDRDRYYNHDNEFLVNIAMGGAGDSESILYALMSNSTEMVYQYGYKLDTAENKNEPWFRSYDGEEYEAVTEAEFDEAIARLEEYIVKPEYKQLSQNKDAMDFSENGVAEAKSDAALPAYEYPGPELFYSVLYKYLADELSVGYDAADVGIPSPIIVAEDESNPDDICVWGDFWYYNYKLNGDTLETVNGGSYPGCVHLKNTDDGYEVVSMDVVADGDDFTTAAKKIFGDHYDEFLKMYSDSDAKEAVRAQIIANYVAANNLPITQYQDTGWDPVTLPEENIDNFYSDFQ